MWPAPGLGSTTATLPLKMCSMKTYGLETYGASLNNREANLLADKVTCWLVKQYL